MLDQKKAGSWPVFPSKTGNRKWRESAAQQIWKQSGNVGEISSVIPARIHEFLVNFFSYNLENTSSEGDTLLHR